MKHRTTLVVAISAGFLGACASITPTREAQTSYVIYDIKAPNGMSDSKVAEAIKIGIQKQSTGVRLSQGIPPSPLPEKPGRFKLVNPFGGSNLSALAASQGQSLQVPTCEGAILTANAGRDGMSKYGEYSSFFLCLLPYQGGYHLDIYSTFTKASGGFSPEALGAVLARSVVGDSSQSIPRTINSVVESVKEAGATIVLVESYP